jgi:FkbM family methyltransferase
MREFLKRVARACGVNVFTIGKFGVDVESDLARLPGASIVSFEPVAASFARLEEATAGLARVKRFNCALGAQPGTARINLTASAGSNTMLPTDAATGSAVVQVETLDRVAAEHDIATIDLLKIDVEGFELQVLAGGETLLSEGRVRYVYAECVLAPDAVSHHTSFAELSATLQSRGFCCVSYYGESFGPGGVALGNALFALRSRLPQSVPGKVRNIL